MAEMNKRKMSGWMARLMSTAEDKEADSDVRLRQDAAAPEDETTPTHPEGADVVSEVPPPAFPNLELPDKDSDEPMVAEPVANTVGEETEIMDEADLEENRPMAAIAVEEAVSEGVLVAEPVAEDDNGHLPGEENGSATAVAPEVEALPEDEEELDEAPAGPAACPACTADWVAGNNFCGDCGYMLPAVPVMTSSKKKESAARAAMPQPKVRIRNRYEVGDLIQEREGICRYRGTDHGQNPPRPITIVWGPLSAGGEADNPFDDVPMAVATEDEDVLPTFDDPVPVAAPVMLDSSGKPISWPSVAWEKNLLEKANHPAVPAVVDHFVENNFEYLILEAPGGKVLWEAWDEPEAGEASVRYGWLKQVAEGLHVLHQAGALLEGIRPDLVAVNAAGQAVIHDLSDLLPIPVPPGAPIRGTLYTAPELMLSPSEADARADMYSFGAMLYSLEYLHHPLEEKNFEHQFAPKSIADEFPDVHPLILRLVNKTFVRDINIRFPTDEAMKTDPSGFEELIRSLEVCRRTLDTCRLDIACWTTTGMVRTGNEDAFTVLHGTDARLDDTTEYAMVLLADGMGGYEAGEIAAAMALNELRTYLLGQPMFAGLTGGTAPAGPVNVDGYKQVLNAALKHANKSVYTAARTPGKGRRGMGCTAEAVYVDGRNVICGHVGDSRTYHVHQGRLVQLTRDQTLVNRLVELGQISAEEAEDHPRKNELQQAIGGQPDVVPGIYSGKLKRGDWVLVCSDGVTNHINNKELEKMLTREAYDSAEIAARRLVNLVNLRGATDNSTVVVIRVC